MDDVMLGRTCPHRPGRIEAHHFGGTLMVEALGEEEGPDDGTQLRVSRRNPGPDSSRRHDAAMARRSCPTTLAATVSKSRPPTPSCLGQGRVGGP